MQKFKVTYTNDITGKTKTCTVKATSICLAIEAAARTLMFNCTITKAELVK